MNIYIGWKINLISWTMSIQKKYVETFHWQLWVENQKIICKFQEKHGSSTPIKKDKQPNL